MKFKTAPAGTKFNFNGDNKSFPMNGVKFQALNIKCYTHEVIAFGVSKIIWCNSFEQRKMLGVHFIAVYGSDIPIIFENIIALSG